MHRPLAGILCYTTFSHVNNKMYQIISPHLLRHPTSPYEHNKTGAQTTGRNPLLYRVFACGKPRWIKLFSHTFCEILLHHTSTAKPVHKPLAGILCDTAFSHFRMRKTKKEFTGQIPFHAVRHLDLLTIRGSPKRGRRQWRSTRIKNHQNIPVGTAPEPWELYKNMHFTNNV